MHLVGLLPMPMLQTTKSIPTSTFPLPSTLVLVWVGNEEAARCKSGGTLIDTAAPAQLLGRFDTLLPRKSRMQFGIGSDGRGVTKFTKVVLSLGCTASAL